MPLPERNSVVFSGLFFQRVELGQIQSGHGPAKLVHVDAVKDGSGAVGTISGGANATVPAQNPVAIATLVDTHTPGAGQLRVISNVRVKPRGWSGYLKVEYQISGNSSNNDNGYSGEMSRQGKVGGLKEEDLLSRTTLQGT
jgi:hypothetical protein